LPTLIDRNHKLARELCAAHQRSHCILVGSGTIGLTLALRSLGVEGKPVAIPNGVCLNVPLAVIFAGGVPRYCDIDPVTLGLSIDSLRRCNPAPVAVIAVHAYGSVCDIQDISEYCWSSGIFLIEDLAVAQGATDRGRPVGAFGDCSVLSFGDGKIVDAGGGGALLTDDISIADAVERLHTQLPRRMQDDARILKEFNRSHTRLYNDHYGRDLDLHVTGFLGQAVGLERAFLSVPPSDVERIAAGLGGLKKNIARRRQFAEKFHEKFWREFENIRSFHPPGGSVYWRFNIFLRDGRDQVLRALLAERTLVSSWFPPVDLFLGGRGVSGAVTPVCDRLGKEIINLWVNEEIDDAYVQRVSTRIKQLVGQVGR
jgi:dTDP-4-amino-4,6-dideoxygalactose transaminase